MNKTFSFLSNNTDVPLDTDQTCLTEFRTMLLTETKTKGFFDWFNLKEQIQQAFINPTNELDPDTPSHTHSNSLSPLSPNRIWMSDHLCNFCYDCGTTFHTFRRKHHCRFCGRIFCNNCCCHFLKGSIFGFDEHTIRICHYCYSHNLSKIDENTPLKKSAFTSVNADIKTEYIHHFLHPDHPVTEEPQTISIPIIDENKDFYGDIDSEQLELGHFSFQKHLDFPLMESITSSIDISHSHHRLSLPDLDFIEKKQDHLSRLNGVIENHLIFCITRWIIQMDLNREWIDIILKFSKIAAHSISPGIFPSDNLDILNYLKIKRVFHGTMYDTYYVDGVICGKNIVNRHMPATIINPKILILDCALEYHRMENRLANMDILLEQEEEYLKLLLKNILRIQPDLIIVGYSVSRLIQERLNELGIGLVLNVHNKLLHRIARATQAYIIPSIDFINTISLDVLGLIISTISLTPPLYHSINISTIVYLSLILGTCSSFRLLTFSDQSSINQTLMCFEGCRPELHGTVCLFGLNREELTSVKRILKLSIHVAYNLHLESSLLFDMGAVFSLESERQIRKSITDIDIPSTSTTTLSSPIDITSSLKIRLNSFYDHQSNIHINEKQSSPSQFQSIPLPISSSPYLMPFQPDPLYYDHLRSLSLNDNRFHYLISSIYLCFIKISPIYLIFTQFLLLLPHIASRYLFHSSFFCGYCWSTPLWQCHLPSVLSIDYYQNTDYSLGFFLINECFDIKKVCSNTKCKKLYQDHCRSFHHNNGRVNVLIQKRDITNSSDASSNPTSRLDKLIYWSLCKICHHSSPPIILSSHSLRYSFGKYLEAFFYQGSSINSIYCGHGLYHQHIHYYKYNDLVASFEYKSIPSYSIYLNRELYSSSILTKPQKDAVISEILSLTSNSIESNDNQSNDISSLLILKAEKLDYLDFYELYDKTISSLSYQSTSIETQSMNQLLDKSFIDEDYDIYNDDENEKQVTSPTSTSPLSTIPSTIPNVRTISQFFKGIGNIILPIIPISHCRIVSTVLTSSEYYAFLKNTTLENINNMPLSQQNHIFHHFEFDLDSSNQTNKEKDHRAILHQVLSNSPTHPHFVFRFFSTITASSYKVTVYCPKQFHALRAEFCGGDVRYIESLFHNKEFSARGGKSGSTFTKTIDDRFIIKYIKYSELTMFLDMSIQYFNYMAKTLFQHLPTSLIKILGLYRITENDSKRTKKYNILVMPNLFFQTNITKVFDLKGSIRNRYVKNLVETDCVLLDENFMEYTQGYPLPLNDISYDILKVCVFNDTYMLSSLGIVDYSLLLGIDENSHELIIGIIDYVHQYTWERQIETSVKSLGMIAGNPEPTVVSPKTYKLRFRLAMDRYFMVSPTLFSIPFNNPKIFKMSDQYNQFKD